MALDLGCGAGLNLDHLARYADPVGTDFSEEALRFCLERGHKRLCKADAAELPFRDRQFDIITALDVVEHLDDDLAALTELRRTLKPGGLLIMSVPAWLNKTLISYYTWEARTLARGRVPFGLSVVCVAQRPPESRA